CARWRGNFWYFDVW
nr:immunoglobulin heavy chain junction region [Mus musculus]